MRSFSQPGARWRCTHWLLMSCSALAHSFADMTRALGDVEVARFEGRHGTHHHPRLTFARGMSLMCRTAFIDAYGRPGHTIFNMALRFDLNPTRELKSTILIALVCSAQCTGVITCILDAVSCETAMTMQTLSCLSAVPFFLLIE